jgi:hypothetical protein
MPGITLKNIPDPLYHQLIAVAKNHRRSLTKEIVFALECYVQQSNPDKAAIVEQIRLVRNRYSDANVSQSDISGWKESGRP